MTRKATLEKHQSVQTNSTEKESGRTVIDSHGLVLIPVRPGGGVIETEGDDGIIQVVGGGTTVQVSGSDVTVNGEPLDEVAESDLVVIGDNDGADGADGADVSIPAKKPLSAGQAAAIAFADAAAKIETERARR